MLTIMVTHVGAASNERVIFLSTGNHSFEIDRFTKKGRDIIRGAVVCAGKWGHTYIGSEHILLSIMEEGTSAAWGGFLKHLGTGESG